ncbi:ribonuclease HII [Candidatus Nitrosacidococcus sp. I8]|uniref:ribonuclease HII n=1 Tax=Candidatus Nitrosacidococcus sp. I8 TaxID=2942908 RepID=UPI0022265F60|nr:ribonuclease HII [Candidatus Nitrosacidococcus sp. I8]CAH9017523.1 Ribonuclease HII [Candidatus Nitrosacidococcus sp. I8]
MLAEKSFLICDKAQLNDEDYQCLQGIQPQTWIAGIDEVGRGPLAGPVIAGAVILDSKVKIEGIRDSKKLSIKRREDLAAKIKEGAIGWSLGRAEREEIDRINIFQATLLAMSRAIATLPVKPKLVLVDGKHCPVSVYPIRGIIKGDQKFTPIAAASIIAKVARDQEMVDFDRIYPNYGFKSNKGYPTKAHFTALENFGPCPIHRRSFRPIKNCFIN